MAVVAAVAASAAVAAAPAGAQDIHLNGEIANECVRDLSIPTCEQWTFDTAREGVQDARDTYNYDVQPIVDDVACIVWDVLDPRDCPVRALTPDI
jgi:hypothetical protein